MRLEEQILKKGCLITGGEDAGGGNGTLLEGPSARNGRSEGGHEEGVEDVWNRTDEEGTVRSVRVCRAGTIKA